MKILHTYINNMYMDLEDPSKECFANKWGLVSLAKAGHDVWLICGGKMDLQEKKTYKWNNINVVELPTLIGVNNTSRILKGFIKELKKHKDADIINTHHYCATIPELTVLTGFFLKIPTIITYHTTFQGRSGIVGFLERVYSVLMIPFLCLYSKHVFISKHISDLFPFKFLPNKKKEIIYNQYKLPPQFPDVKKENTALFVGRITYLKGIDIIIKSLPKVIKVFPNFKVNLMGKYEGNFKEKMISLASKINVEKNIQFLGPIYGAKKWEEFAKTKFLIMPSRNEGFGNVVVEAMLTKLPVISSNQGALPEAGGGHSFIFDINKPEELSKKIIELLSNENLCSQKSIKGYNYALPFTKNKNLIQYEELYRQLKRKK